ncbi:hypothetical protein ACEWY4_022730 [Coilia grayii]|uniref:C1q domain-containing protein n=1 Tax=Coilia grayii TaxID=363190 RepID=A0ABD1J1D2_9TELE
MWYKELRTHFIIFSFRVTLKMRAAISLLVLLFSMCGAQTRSTQTEVQTESQSQSQLDVSAELKELRDMVVELRVTLRYTQDELKVMEVENSVVLQRLVASETKVEILERENAAQEAELTAVKTRLAASEAEVEQVKKDTAAQHTDLTTMKTEVMNLTKENAALETRLAATETDVEELKMDSAAHEQELAALKTRLAASETGIDDLKAELTAVKTRLAATETEVDNLEKLTEKSKVAFSVGLTDSGYIESGSNDLNLVFSKIINNVGKAYSSTTGFFTAPVRGVYYFRFTVMDYLFSHYMGIQMYKNGQQLMLLNEYDSDGQNSYLSSGLTLQLEVGDEINLRIPAGSRLYDNVNNHTTFSGFLLFPL